MTNQLLFFKFKFVIEKTENNANKYIIIVVTQAILMEVVDSVLGTENKDECLQFQD